MNIKLLSLIAISLILSACTATKQNPKPGPGPEPTTETYTVNFSNMDLGNAGLLQSSDSTFKQKTINYISSNTNEYIKDIDYTDENEIRFQKDNFPLRFDSPQALILGSQNYDGYLEMQFSKSIYSVTIKAQQYYKIFTYGDDPTAWFSYDCQLWDDETSGYIGDPNTALLVNNQEMGIPAVTYEFEEDGYTPIPLIPEMAQETLMINSHNLKLYANASYRIRVFELELKFIVE